MKVSIIISLISLVVAAPAPEPQGSISNGALRHGGIPCSPRDASAANCRPGAVANPPSRGCSPIEDCRGGPGSSVSAMDNYANMDL
ncbi:hypothetical protein FOBRF1_006712 [Fusarium oxysporum]